LKTNYNGFISRSSDGSAKKKERQGETQFATKTEVPPPLNADFILFLNLLK
jgi:hypothetical protein